MEQGQQLPCPYQFPLCPPWPTCCYDCYDEALVHTDSQHYTVGIAGAGLLGRLLAWQLLRTGHKVTLYEAGTLSSPACAAWTDRKSTRLNSSHVAISYAVFCLKNQTAHP